ncbi:MAG: exosortase-associated EpsI family protein [Phycisphaerales bacterium JB064]
MSGGQSRIMGLPSGVVIAAVVAVVLLAASGAVLGISINALGLYLKKSPIYPRTGLVMRDVPAETPNWRRVGPDRFESPEIESTLGTTNYVTRTYEEKDPPQGESPRSIDIHVAYYTGSIDTVPHIPERCFVGGGMQIGGGTKVVGLPLDDSQWLPMRDAPEMMDGRAYTATLARGNYSNRPGQRVLLPLDPRDIQLRVTEFSVPGRPSLYAGYFFIVNGEHRSSAEGVRLLAFDLKTDYAYYLKVQFNSQRVQSAEELAEVAGDLLNDLLGELMLCVPDWAEVTRGAWPEEGSSDKEGPATRG